MKSAWFVLLAAATVGCAELTFPEVSNVSEVQPGERVVIGRIQYANGGEITQWVSGSFERSWPYFSYDLAEIYGPGSRRAFRESPLSPRGGVFAIRVKPGTVYLHSIAVVTKSLLRPETAWTFPIMLKLPPSNARCTFAGTIVVSFSGEHSTGLPWYAYPGYRKETGTVAKATVFDTYDRDRAALSAKVKGCDLERALAMDAPRDEVEPLLRAAAKAEAEEKAYNDSRVSP